MMSELPILLRTFKPQATTSQFAAVVWFYDMWALLTEDRAVRRALKLAQVQDNQSILEVAVGTGKLFSLIVARNPHGRNEGMDLSPAMLARARRRLQQMPSAAYKLQLGSAYELPYKDGIFDLLFNTYMLDLLPEQDFSKVLSEFRRVLRPDGKIVLVSFGFGTYWFNRFWYWLAKAFPALLTNCRPVRIGRTVALAGFHNLHVEQVSQNTFPSDIVVAEK
jgi:ubiquinone/menaquinone biosynthesis C-methylase UbiE